MADQVGEQDIRTQDWRKDLVGFALREFTLLEDLTLIGTSAWINSFYQETSTELSAGGTRSIKGIGRGSALPTAKVSWTLNTSYIQKYGLEDEILYEDAISDNVDVVGRTLLRVARGVVKSVEDEIFAIVTESQSVVNINSTTTTSVGGDQWDAALVSNNLVQSPVKDILDAMRQIAVNNYKEVMTGAGFLWLSPKDYMSIMFYCYHLGANAPKFGEKILADGRLEQTFMGLKVRISNSVVADYSVVGVSKRCATWKELESLKTSVKEDAPTKFTIRAWMFGITQLTDPKAITLIIDTQT